MDQITGTIDGKS